MTTIEPAAAPKALGDRLLDIWPLLFSFLVIASLYVWQASKHPTPWLFSDEIEYAQISRAIAETGTPARRGVEYWGAGLFPWLIAPFWWIDSLGTAYSAVKTFNSLVMTAAMFPTYALARMLMSRPYALLAAIGSVLAPFFIYSAMLMQEPIAYFAAALSFYVTARVLVAPSRWNIGAAIILAVVVPFVRDELVVVPAIMVGSVALQYICFGGGRDRLRPRLGSRFAPRSLVAAVVIVVLGLVVARAGLGEVADAFRSPGTMLDQALWAWGAMIVGLGVLPVVIGLTMAIPAKSQRQNKAVAAFASLLGVSLVILTAYVAVKGAYQAAVFEARVEERNLLYLTPLLMIALVFFAATRVLTIWALAVAAALTAWSISSLPLNLVGLEGDAPGLAILSRLHDNYELGLHGANQLLYGLLVLSVLVGLAPRLLHQRRIATWVVVAAVVASIGWSTWAEVAAAKYSNDFSALFYDGLPKPSTGSTKPPETLRPFTSARRSPTPTASGRWSSGIATCASVWSLDGTAPGPGPVLTPDLISTDGRLADDPGYELCRHRQRPFDRRDDGCAAAACCASCGSRSRSGFANRSPGYSTTGGSGARGLPGSVIADYNKFVAPEKPGMVVRDPIPEGILRATRPRPRSDPGRHDRSRTAAGRDPRPRDAAARLGDRQLRGADVPDRDPGGPFHVKVTVDAAVPTRNRRSEQLRAALLRRAARPGVRAARELISIVGRRAPPGACARTGPCRAGARGCGGRGTSCRSPPRRRG